MHTRDHCPPPAPSNATLQHTTIRIPPSSPWQQIFDKKCPHNPPPPNVRQRDCGAHSTTDPAAYPELPVRDTGTAAINATPPCHRPKSFANPIPVPHFGKLGLRYPRPLGVGALKEDVVPLSVRHGGGLDAARAGAGTVEVVLPLEQMRHGVIRPVSGWWNWVGLVGLMTRKSQTTKRKKERNIFLPPGLRSRIPKGLQWGDPV